MLDVLQKIIFWKTTGIRLIFVVRIILRIEPFKTMFPDLRHHCRNNSVAGMPAVCAQTFFLHPYIIVILS